MHRCENNDRSNAFYHFRHDAKIVRCVLARLWLGFFCAQNAKDFIFNKNNVPIRFRNASILIVYLFSYIFATVSNCYYLQTCKFFFFNTKKKNLNLEKREISFSKKFKKWHRSFILPFDDLIELYWNIILFLKSDATS